MNIEIERKWIVDTESIPYDLMNLESVHIDQSYISFSPAIRIRNIDFGKKYIMTVKTHINASVYSRNEHEFEIPENDYISLLNQKRGNTISKTRYINYIYGGLKEEIDVFEGALSGLAYVEVEFENESQAETYVPPLWYGRDVSEEKEYSNSSLAQHGMPAN